MSNLKISDFLKEKVTSQNKSHYTLSQYTVAVNGGKIQIYNLRGVKVNQISVFLDLFKTRPPPALWWCHLWMAPNKDQF